MAVSYHDKSFLVIDDFPEFRRSVRNLVQQLGAPDVDMAGSGEEALAFCQKKRYDIILSDYNLGDAKDGQQLLEELYLKNLLKPSAIFVMITAENTTAMVMGALEHQPDAYLTKPFNKAALQQRLDKLVEKKESTRAIDTALEKKDWEKVLSLCDDEINANSKIALYALRTKAEVLEKLGKRDKAAEIYASASKDRPIPWALMGLGRMLLERGDAVAARDHFESVVKQLPMLLSAQDGLAKALMALGESKRAIQVLSAAAKLSPKAVTRQSMLGQLAYQEKDFETAAKAYRSAVSQGRHSVHKAAENYLQLASSLSKTMTSGHVENKRIAEEAQRALHELDTDYKGDNQLAMRSLLMQGELLHKQKKPSEANAAVAGAKKLLAENNKTLPPDIALQVAEQFKMMDQAEVARDVLQQCLDMYGDDPRLQERAAEIVDDLRNAAQSDQAVRHNSEGVEAFQQQRHDDAVMAFRKAIALSPRNISIVLNTAQVLLEVAKRQNFPMELLNECSECLNRVQSISSDDKRYQRYSELVRLTAEYKTKAIAAKG